MQTERDTNIERDTILQEDTHTPEGKTHTHTHTHKVRERNVYKECEAHPNSVESQSPNGVYGLTPKKKAFQITLLFS